MVQLIVALTVLSVYLLMVLGGLVTSTGSGLACPDWPLCYGTVAPPLKLDVWLEWGHRLLGGITGLLILASTVLVCRRYRNASRVTAGATLALLVGVVVLGGVVVLVDAPLLRTAWHTLITSSHIVLSTLILVSLVFTYALVRTKDPGTGRLPLPSHSSPSSACSRSSALLSDTARPAAYAPISPTCQGMWVPPLESFQILVHLGHRILAVAVFVFAAAVLIKKPSALTALTFGIVAAQAAWGVLSVLTGLFLPVVFLHIATGFFLIGWTAYHAAPALFFPAADRPERKRVIEKALARSESLEDYISSPSRESSPLSSSRPWRASRRPPRTAGTSSHLLDPPGHRSRGGRLGGAQQLLRPGRSTA